MSSQYFEWDGTAMHPLRPRVADAEFVIGQKYLLEEIQDRSMNSHRFYFVALTESWRNLREDQADRFPTVESLRKHALIQTGWRDERTLVAGSKQGAQKLAAFIKPLDEHAVIVVRDFVVRVWTARSQSMKAMGKQDFQRSKDDVLAFVSDMVGVTPATLSENAGKAA